MNGDDHRLLPDQRKACELANLYFSMYPGLDTEFRRYGFDINKDPILFGHEIGLLAYFEISEKLYLVSGNGSESIKFLVGVYRGPAHIDRIASINVILYRDIEINGEKITMPIGSEKFMYPCVPTKDDILKHPMVAQENEKFSKAKMILENLQSRNVTISPIENKRRRSNR